VGLPSWSSSRSGVELGCRWAGVYSMAGLTGWLDGRLDIDVDDVEPDQVVLSDDIMQVTGAA
jgi:hypothetical protein